MKQFFSLFLSSMVAICVQAQTNTVDWKVGETPSPMGQYISVNDNSGNEVLKLAFGTTDPNRDDAAGWSTGPYNCKINYEGIEFLFENYMTTTNTSGNNKSNLNADGTSIGNYVAFTPKYNGTLIIAVSNMGSKTAGNKPTILYEDGVQKGGLLINLDPVVEYDGATDLATLNNSKNYTGGIQVTVKGGSVYTISANGSKGRWEGLIYNYDSTTSIVDIEGKNSIGKSLFNLAGQKVTHDYKGIVIINGKKQIQD